MALVRGSRPQNYGKYTSFGKRSALTTEMSLIAGSRRAFLSSTSSDYHKKKKKECKKRTSDEESLI